MLRPFSARLRPACLAAGLALAGLSALAGPANAGYGTLAWAKWDSPVRLGPGTGYAVTGTLLEHTRIVVFRCKAQWCEIGGADKAEGWVARPRIDFGQGPHAD